MDGTAAVQAELGGDQVPHALRVHRAKIYGPAGTTMVVYVSQNEPVQDDIVDRTHTGANDYAHWDPPLWVPAGWFLRFRWSGGCVSTVVGLLGADSSRLRATALLIVQPVPDA